MPVYDTFGFLCSDLERVRGAVEACLGIRFAPHESSFLGDYYLYGERYEKGNLLLRINLDPEDGEAAYPEFSEFPVILEASDPDEPERLSTLLKSRVAGCKLLRHEVVS